MNIYELLTPIPQNRTLEIDAFYNGNHTKMRSLAWILIQYD